jgi:putative ABC transport system permease protein
VPLLQADAKKPILEPVPPGTLTEGWELHRSLKLRLGDKARLLGREFTVSALRPERGTKDDITVWINLKEAQELLNRGGRINGILALECVCAADSLDKVRAEISRILPETQVIEFQSQTLARAEARRRAATEAAQAIQQEKNNRARLRQERESFGGILVPVVVAASAAWIALLSLNNVRQRRSEIGILRALGTGTGQIMAIFLGRAALMGLAGAVPGYTAGWLAGVLWHEAGPSAGTALAPLDPMLGLAVLAGTPLLALLAAWLPAYLAAQKDPAQILTGE